MGNTVLQFTEWLQNNTTGVPMTVNATPLALVSIYAVAEPHVLLGDTISITADSQRFRGYTSEYHELGIRPATTVPDPYVVRISVPSTAGVCVCFVPASLQSISVDVFPGQEIDLRYVSRGDIYYVTTFETTTISSATGVVDMVALRPRFNQDALTSARLIEVMTTGRTNSVTHRIHIE